MLLYVCGLVVVSMLRVAYMCDIMQIVVSIRLVCVVFMLCVFFFKQKTAYEI